MMIDMDEHIDGCDTCVVCGRDVPEGRQVCEQCNSKYFVDRNKIPIFEKALEKQIPKKPIETDWIYCPNCNVIFGVWGEEKYCTNCGQKLDWSEEE